MQILSSPLIDYLFIPLLIFCLRICDVTLDTLRIIFMTKGYRNLAPIIGFFEILIWVFAITRIMQNLENWVCFVAYAGGFATGNYIGMLLDEKLAIGHQIIRVITKVDTVELADLLRKSGFGVTSVEASGMQGEVAILYIVVDRKNQKHAIEIIQKHSPNAFFTVENLHYVNKLLSKDIIKPANGSAIFPFVRH
jgi:uncharacterized protein YebE (UPF0316 family)